MKKDNKKYRQLMALKNPAFQKAFRLVVEHPNYPDIASNIISFKKENDDVPSIEWMFSHAKYKGIKLPKYFDTWDMNIYTLTGNDRRDYEKKFLTRSKIWQKNRKIDAICAKTNAFTENEDTMTDIFMKRVHDIDEMGQRDMEKFLEGREVKPLDIKFDGKRIEIHLD